MSLDVTDTVKSTFGSLKSETGLRILGLMFAVQLANMSSSMMLEAGTATATAAGGIITMLAAFAGILITVGGLRSLDTGAIKKEQYTENIFTPVVRLIGANVVTTVFGYGLALIAFLPAIVAGILAGAGMSAPGSMMNAGLPIVILGALGAVTGIAAFAYVFLTLILSVPMIAADNSRLFQSLDRSVQRTTGNRISMLVTVLPIGLVYLLGISLILLVAPSANGALTVPYAVAASAVSSIIAVLMFSLLTELNKRLPE